MEKLFFPAKKLTLHAAKVMATAARKEAEKHGVPGAFAVVDDGANLMYLERWDHTMIAASKIAIDKASTAVLFKRPSKDIEEVIANGRTAMLAVNGTVPYVPLMGGYPVLIEGSVIGGIAVAGTLKAEMDEVVVLAALNVLDEKPPADVK